MAAPLRHFAVNADDTLVARRFYEAVFGWRFTPWGPPGFFHIDLGDVDPGDAATSGPPLMAALQGRRDLVDGERTLGFECTFAVDDVATVARLVVDHGGRVLAEPTTIAGVGELLWFTDPSGNVVGAMRYDENAG
jgi:predicted enzyme related to lactoylglutathione lyase